MSKERFLKAVTFAALMLALTCVGCVGDAEQELTREALDDWVVASAREGLKAKAPNEWERYETAKAALKRKAAPNAWAVYVEAGAAVLEADAAVTRYDDAPQRAYDAARQAVELSAPLEWATYNAAMLMLKAAAEREWSKYAALEAAACLMTKARATLIEAASDEWTAYEKALAASIEAAGEVDNRAAYEKAEAALKRAALDERVPIRAAEATEIETDATYDRASEAVDKANDALKRAAPDEFAAYAASRERIEHIMMFGGYMWRY